MQRRDPKTFLEEVLSQVKELSPDTREKLLALTSEKAGTKRAQKIAALLSSEKK